MNQHVPHHFGVVSDNTYTFTTLASVLPQLIGLCGVYVIKNLTTGQEYVGSSLSLGLRLNIYLKLIYISIAFSLAYDLFRTGKANFVIRVIVVDQRQNSVALEQYFLDNCPMEYNTSRNSLLGFYKFYIFSAVSFAFGVELCDFFDSFFLIFFLKKKITNKKKGVLCLVMTFIYS